MQEKRGRPGAGRITRPPLRSLVSGGRPDQAPHFVEASLGVDRPLDDGRAIGVAVELAGLELAELCAKRREIAGEKGDRIVTVRNSCRLNQEEAK